MSSDYMTNFGWLKLSERNPIHSVLTDEDNLPLLRFLKGRSMKFRMLNYVYINKNHSLNIKNALQSHNGGGGIIRNIYRERE